MPGKIRCPICKGCMDWKNAGPHRFVYCDLCRQYYKLLPGRNIKSVMDDVYTSLKAKYGDTRK